MAGSVTQQIERLSGKGFLNSIDDAVIGGIANTLTGASYFGGQLGDRFTLSHAMALQCSDPAVGTLYGGKYQYVKTKAGSTAAPARGLIAFWDDMDDYVVTPDAPTGTACIAGVYIGAPTKGQYCYIQTGGLASVKFAADITKATPASQDFVIVGAGTNLADVIEDATTLTSVEMRSALGNCSGVPTTNAINLVQLRYEFENI